MVMWVAGGGDLLVRYRFRGIDIFLHKSGELVLELAHLRRGCEIHTCLPLRMRSHVLSVASCDDSFGAGPCQTCQCLPGYPWVFDPAVTNNQTHPSKKLTPPRGVIAPNQRR